MPITTSNIALIKQPLVKMTHTIIKLTKTIKEKDM